MRFFAALVALVALGCSTSWHPIAAPSIKYDAPELLFVMTAAKAYVLVGSRLEAGVVHGAPMTEWDRDPNTPFSPQWGDSPEELAKRSHWTQVAAHNGAVAIPLGDIRYSSAGDPPSDPTLEDVRLALIALGVVVVLLVVAVGSSR